MHDERYAFVFVLSGSSSIMYLSYNAVNKFLQVHIVVYLHVSYLQKILCC